MTDTDNTSVLHDLDAGIFVSKLDKAMSQVALGVVNEERKGKIVIELKIEQIGSSNQVKMAHKFKYEQPTARGKLIEEDETITPLYVNRSGKLSLMPDTQEKFNFDQEEQNNG